MTSHDSKIVTLLASKLGVDSDGAVKKASEFIRLLQLRVTASSGLRQLSDTCRVVLCIDLACNALNIPLDKKDVLRLAGVNKNQYSNGRHLVEKLLDLSTPLTVRTICVQLGVSEIASFAQKLLDTYADLYKTGPQGGRPLDLSFPMYHAAAVFVACRHHKIKIDRTKVLDTSRVKRAQFDKLVEDYAPALQIVGSSEVRKVATKRSHKLMDLVDKYVQDSEKEKVSTEKNLKDPAEEDFESWKRRILGEVDAD